MKAPRGLIGVVHLPAMPGDPAFDDRARAQGARGSGFGEVLDHALADARAWVAGGIGALVIENFGSAPFFRGDERGRLPAHQVAFYARVLGALAELGVPLGVNCLRNDALSALGIAAACEGAFVRVNVHVGAYVTDQGLLEGEADRSLRYRSALGAQHVAILADVLVKHAAPLAPLDASAAVHDLIDRGLADGVIVSGQATGAPVDPDLLSTVSAAAGTHPVYIGSGLTVENAASLAPLCQGAIVGTAAKRGGDVRAPVDSDRVRRLVEATRDRFRS